MLEGIQISPRKTVHDSLIPEPLFIQLATCLVEQMGSLVLHLPVVGSFLISLTVMLFVSGDSIELTMDFSRYERKIDDVLVNVRAIHAIAKAPRQAPEGGRIVNSATAFVFYVVLVLEIRSEELRRHKHCFAYLTGTQPVVETRSPAIFEEHSEDPLGNRQLSHCKKETHFEAYLYSLFL